MVLWSKPDSGCMHCVAQSSVCVCSYRHCVCSSSVCVCVVTGMDTLIGFRARADPTVGVSELVSATVEAQCVILVFLVVFLVISLVVL